MIARDIWARCLTVCKPARVSEPLLRQGAGRAWSVGEVAPDGTINSNRLIVASGSHHELAGSAGRPLGPPWPSFFGRSLPRLPCWNVLALCLACLQLIRPRARHHQGRQSHRAPPTVTTHTLRPMMPPSETCTVDQRNIQRLTAASAKRQGQRSRKRQRHDLWNPGVQ